VHPEEIPGDNRFPAYVSGGPNLLNRDLQSAIRIWFGCRTYVSQSWKPLDVPGCVYRSLFAHGGQLALSGTLDHQFVLDAFKRALWQRRPPKGLMVHSDRGVQYACDTFQNAVNTSGCIQSMSRKGNCWDNAVAESFFHLFKSELGEEFSDNHSAIKTSLSILKSITIVNERMRRLCNIFCVNSLLSSVI